MLWFQEYFYSWKIFHLKCRKEKICRWLIQYVSSINNAEENHATFGQKARVWVEKTFTIY